MDRERVEELVGEDDAGDGAGVEPGRVDDGQAGRRGARAQLGQPVPVELDRARSARASASGEPSSRRPARIARASVPAPAPYSRA